MNKERIQRFQKNYETFIRSTMTDHQKDLMYRCFLLGLEEEAIRLVLSAKNPYQEEYLIASFLDGIDIEFIKHELLPEKQVSRLQGKRLDYLLEHFRTADTEYLKLQDEVEQARRYRGIAEEQREVLLNKLNELRTEMKNLQNTKQQLSFQVQQLEREKQTLEKEKKNFARIHVSESVFESQSNEKNVEMSSIWGKLKALLCRERSDTEEVEDGNMIELLCNSKFDLPQLKELQQGFFDGIPYHELKKIAKPELPVEIIREMRLFMCRKYNLSTNQSEPSSEKKANLVRPFHEAQEEKLNIIEEEPEELSNNNSCDEDSPAFDDSFS